MGLPDGAINIFLRRSKKDFRTKALKNKAPLSADTFRHTEIDFISLCRSDHCDGNSRVARSWFQNYLVSGQFTTFFRFGYHIEGGSVFHRPSRVASLKFAENFHVWVFIDIHQLNEWRIADCL